MKHALGSTFWQILKKKLFSFVLENSLSQQLPRALNIGHFKVSSSLHSTGILIVIWYHKDVVGISQSLPHKSWTFFFRKTCFDLWIFRLDLLFCQHSCLKACHPRLGRYMCIGKKETLKQSLSKTNTHIINVLNTGYWQLNLWCLFSNNTLLHPKCRFKLQFSKMHLK